MNVICFVSRNKDNTHIPNFKRREYRFLFDYENSNIDLLNKKLKEFISNSRPDEVTRVYTSVNERNMEKTRRELLKFLIDNPDYNLSKIESKTVSIANKEENALTRYWMFDFDCELKTKLDEFINDIHKASPLIPLEYSMTPNGYCIIVKERFDYRELMEKWKDTVELKKDAMKFICIRTRKDFGL